MEQDELKAFKALDDIDGADVFNELNNLNSLNVKNMPPADPEPPAEPEPFDLPESDDAGLPEPDIDPDGDDPDNAFPEDDYLPDPELAEEDPEEIFREFLCEEAGVKRPKTRRMGAGVLSKLFSWAGGPSSIKTGKAVLFLANLFLMLPFVLRQTSVKFFAVLAVVLLIQIIGIVVKSKYTICATAFLPTFFFFDVLLLIAAFAIPLLDAGRPAMTLAIRPDIITMGVAAAGLVLYFFKGWLSSLGFLLFSLSAEFLLFGGGTLIRPVLDLRARTILFTTLMGSCLWIVLYRLSVVKTVNKGKLNKVLGLIMLALLLAVQILWKQQILNRTAELGVWLYNFNTDVMPWSKCIVFAVAALLLAALAFDYEVFRFTADSEVYTVIGFGILLTKVVSMSYFPFSWVLVVLYFLVCLRCLFHADERMMGFTIPAFYPVLFLVMLACAWMLRNGLLLNVIVTILGFGILGNAWGNRTDSKPAVKWVWVLIFIALEGFTFALIKRNALPIFLMLAVELVISAAAVIVISMRYKKEGGPEPKFCLPVCAVLALLVLATVGPRGIKTDFRVDNVRGIPMNVTTQIQAAGKNDHVVSVEYAWSEQPIASFYDSRLAGTQAGTSGFSDGVSGKLLVVSAETYKHIRSESYYWVTNWKAEWLYTGLKQVT